ncbi:phage tail protein [Sporomusa sp. KB1]|uniref:TipJ family phage tail tip protein n=1 Tax=Sporomusa sp. KB1 TaxID=943346 RepID=UPI0011A4B17C|nr:phage tail protein [Sporomusa sp. KB1]TWH49587.1 putative tail protein [Sporomusa sp. KB1]
MPGKRLTEYIEEPDIDYILNSNFVEQPELTYPADGDQIVIMPHVSSGLKKILGTIASMLLMSYVGNIAGGLWTAGKVGLTSYLAAGAVMAIGGKLINTMFGTKANSISSEGSSQTYGWNTPSPLSGEGNVIGVTYGECIPAPQILETHIDTVNDKQYLNVLLCGGMGPIDEITDIKIGGNPIENYTDVSYEIRYGTNDQEVIPNFGDTTNNQELSYELSESNWSTQLIDGSNAEGLQITLEFPNGLYHINKKGNLENASVTLAVEYRLQGDSAWTNWFGNGSHIASTSIAGATCYPTAPVETWTISVINTGTGTNVVIVKGSVSGTQLPTAGGAIVDNGRIKFTAPNKRGTYKIVIANNSIISAAQNTAVRRSFRIDNLTAGKYEVRAKVTARSAATTSTMDCTTCYLTQLTSIIYDDFSRPNKVLVGIRVLATSQLSSGMPDVTWRQKRNTVYVWNPEISAYETRAANNPVWAAYDIYHQCRYLKNINTGLYEYTVFGVTHTRLDPYWEEWVECAAYADEQVLGTDRTTYEKRFEFDAFFDSAQKRYDAAQQAANVGHATIMPRGNNIGIVCDKPGTMTQVFGEGRTTMSSLQGTFSGIDDRATAVEVVFSDTDNDFKNKQFLVRSPKWAAQTAAQDNPAQLQLFGVKRKSQAYREGMYTLANNLLITQFVDIGTDIDALVCQYGDIIGLNHTVSEMGIASGRLISATASTVTLDKTVKLTTGQSYQIIITLSVSDVIVKRSTVPVTADTETNVLTVTQPFTVIPAQYDNYMFGEADKAVKPFRVVGIEKSGDLTCKLSLAEYVAGVYTGDLNYPIIDYTPQTSTLADVIGMSLSEESYRTTEGTSVSLIHASWSLQQGKSADSFHVWYSDDNASWIFWESTYNMMSTISGIIPGKTYYVKVCASNGLQQSAGVIKSILIIGNTDTPPVVTDITFEEHSRDVGNGVVVIDLQVSFTTPDYEFYKYCDAYMKSNNPAADEILEITESMLSTPYEDLATVQQGWKFFGNPINTFTVQNVVQGHIYSFKLVSVAKGDIKADFDTAPTATYTVGGKTYAPFKPSGFAITITETATLSWMAATQTDVDFTEARTDTNTGSDTNKLIKTTANKAVVTLPTRSGRVYLYHHNTAGKYSDDVWAEYNKPAPAAPTNVIITDIFQGIVITCDALPAYCLGINVHINDTVYFSKNNSYTFKTTGGIYDIQIAYVDLFGEGILSAVVQKVVKATIDPALIAKESLSLEMMDALIKAAVAKAQVAIDQTVLNTALDGVSEDLSTAITDVNTNITNTKTELNTTITALDLAKVSNITFTSQVNALTQADTDNRSLINQNANSITSMIGTLNSAPNAAGQYSAISSVKQTADAIITTLGKAPDAVGQYTAITSIKTTADAIITTLAKAPDAAGQYAAITTLKTTADGLASTVTANKTATDNSISTVSQKADAIIATLAKAPDASGQYTAITTLKATADGLATTVASNKTSADTAISNVSQTANAIITTLGKAPNATGQYSAISQLKATADSISTTVQSNKTTQDGINTSVSSQITQNANSITSVITELGKSLDTCSYTAIAQANSAIQLRATKANLISLINVCPEAITLKSSLIRISGDTQIDGNVITSGMIQSSAITATKIATGAVTADKMSVTSLSAITANIGTLRTATTGARSEISNNLILVYDANNVLRVRMGVW